MTRNQTKVLSLLRLRWGRRKIPHKHPSHLVVICNGPHKARDCLKKERHNALIATKEDNHDLEIPIRVNLFHILNAIQEDTYKGLMYVEIAMGRQKVVALVDSGATQNLNGMFIMDETWPCYVHGLSKPPKKPSKEGTISTLQVEKGLRKGQLTYVITLIEIKLENMVEVFDEVMPIYKSM